MFRFLMIVVLIAAAVAFQTSARLGGVAPKAMAAKAPKMSEKAELKAILENLESQVDEFSTTVIMVQTGTQFDKACDELLLRIKSWKEGNIVPSQEDMDWAEARIKWMKARHQSLQSRTTNMNNDITELRGRLRNEEQLRKNDNTLLSRKISELENDKLEMRRLMIVRQLGQSVQHYMTQLFPPHVFTTKFTHQCTYENIQDKSKKLNNNDIKTIFNDISTKFIESGVSDLNDIGPMIKEIRDLGTGTSHPNRMIKLNEEGFFVEFVPTADEVRTIINEVDLSTEIKSYAQVLVNMLVKIVPLNEPIIYSKV